MDPILTMTVGAVAVMTAVSGLCSATETALLSASRARLHQIARKGKPRKSKAAGDALHLLDNMEQMLSTLVLVNNTLNVASSTLTSAVLVESFGPVGVAYATVAMAVVILVLAEAMPKALGTRTPEKIALAMAPTVRGMIWALGPVLWCLSRLIEGILWTFGMRKRAQTGMTEADLRGLVQLGVQGGVLTKDIGPMLEAVMDLSTLTAGDIMVHRSAMAVLDVATPPADVPEKLAGLGHSRVPLFEGSVENVVGVLGVRDYLAALATAKSRHEVNVRMLMKPLYFIPETTPVNHQLKAFLQRHEHMALVVDEYGDVRGLLTLEDILEEIVGEIADEQDTRRNRKPWGRVERMDDGSVLMPGAMAIRDANRLMGWELSDEEAVTLAGLMQEELGHVPVQGEHVEVGGLRLVVKSRRGHKVDVVEVRPL